MPTLGDLVFSKCKQRNITLKYKNNSYMENTVIKFDISAIKHTI